MRVWADEHDRALQGRLAAGLSVRQAPEVPSRQFRETCLPGMGVISRATVSGCNRR